MSFNRDLGLRAGEAAAGEPRPIDLVPEARHEVAPGVVHFAVLATLAEVAAAEAAGSAVVPTAISIQLMRRARSDRALRGLGRVLKAGRTLIFAEGEVTQDGELVAKATVTFARS